VLLTPEEESELGRLSRAGDRDARDRLVECNLGLVFRIARDFAGRGLDPEDLAAEGNLGLIRAAQDFDPSFGVRFSTYAAHWIRQAIREAILKTGHPIRLPAHVYQHASRWRRAAAELAAESGAEPSSDEVAARLGLDGPRRRMVEQALLALVAGQQWGGDPDGGPRGDEVAAPAGDPWSGLVAEEQLRWLRGALGGLDERGRLILELRHGLDGCGPRTLREVGERVGATREWTRRLEARALRALAERGS
jgi:RNA polymerase primary sigma factor